VKLSSESADKYEVVSALQLDKLKKFTNVVYSAENNRVYLVGKQKDSSSAYDSLWITYFNLSFTPSVEYYEIRQSKEENVGMGELSVLLTTGVGKTDNILIMQAGSYKYSGYFLHVDKDTKFTLTRENGDSQTAILNKPAGALVNIFSDSSTFYVVTKQGLDPKSVDYYYSSCIANSTSKIQCYRPNHILKDVLEEGETEHNPAYIKF
jgi:hypothetical protein